MAVAKTFGRSSKGACENPFEHMYFLSKRTASEGFGRMGFHSSCMHTMPSCWMPMVVTACRWTMRHTWFADVSERVDAKPVQCTFSGSNHFFQSNDPLVTSTINFLPRCGLRLLRSHSANSSGSFWPQQFGQCHHFLILVVMVVVVWKPLGIPIGWLWILQGSCEDRLAIAQEPFNVPSDPVGILWGPRGRNERTGISAKSSERVLK